MRKAILTGLVILAGFGAFKSAEWYGSYLKQKARWQEYEQITPGISMDPSIDANPVQKTDCVGDYLRQHPDYPRDTPSILDLYAATATAVQCEGPNDYVQKLPGMQNLSGNYSPGTLTISPE